MLVYDGLVVVKCLQFVYTAYCLGFYVVVDFTMLWFVDLFLFWYV